MTSCPVCKFPINVHEQPGYRSEHCSEFCATTSEEERKKFLTLEPGDYGVWPCPDCGLPLEDNYSLNSCCGDCGKLRSAATQAFEVVRRNIESKISALGSSGMPLEAGLLLVLRDIEAFRKMSPPKIAALLAEPAKEPS